MEFHEVAQIFPLMAEYELNVLAEDVKANGLREPIITYDGKIIDGRNRYLACQKAGVEPRFEEWSGDGSLIAFVVSLNLHRRHLDETQRSIAAAKALPMYEEEAKTRKEATWARPGEKIGKDRGDCPQPSESAAASPESMGRASDKAGKDFNVDGRTVRKGKKVLKTGIPELIEKVEQGEISVNAAEMIATLPAEEQREVLTGTKKEIQKKAKEIREARKKEPKACKVTVVENPHPEREFSDAWQFAHIAISQLSRIRKNDPNREKECRKVIEWIENFLKE